ncbi:MAG TPA: hypothetical protein VGR35_11795 [Tepidisphaeraceae bacterium]|nr:hypothetical protein [Tepidisphaeraceae bacterium]
MRHLFYSRAATCVWAVALFAAALNLWGRGYLLLGMSVLGIACAAWRLQHWSAKPRLHGTLRPGWVEVTAALPLVFSAALWFATSRYPRHIWKILERQLEPPADREKNPC